MSRVFNYINERNQSIKVNITLHKLEMSQQIDPCQIQIIVKRGQLKFETSQQHPIQNRVATLNESIAFTTTLGIEKTTQEFKPKPISIQINAQTEKGILIIGYVSIDIAQLLNKNQFHSHQNCLLEKSFDKKAKLCFDVGIDPQREQTTLDSLQNGEENIENIRVSDTESQDNTSSNLKQSRILKEVGIEESPSDQEQSRQASKKNSLKVETPRESNSQERPNYAYKGCKGLKPHLIVSPRQYQISPRVQSARSSSHYNQSTNSNSLHTNNVNSNHNAEKKAKSKLIKVGVKDQKQQQQPTSYTFGRNQEPSNQYARQAQNLHSHSPERVPRRTSPMPEPLHSNLKKTPILDSGYMKQHSQHIQQQINQALKNIKEVEIPDNRQLTQKFNTIGNQIMKNSHDFSSQNSSQFELKADSKYEMNNLQSDSRKDIEGLQKMIDGSQNGDDNDQQQQHIQTHRQSEPSPNKKQSFNSNSLQGTDSKLRRNTLDPYGNTSSELTNLESVQKEMYYLQKLNTELKKEKEHINKKYRQLQVEYRQLEGSAQIIENQKQQIEESKEESRVLKAELDQLRIQQQNQRNLASTLENYQSLLQKQQLESFDLQQIVKNELNQKQEYKNIINKLTQERDQMETQMEELKKVNIGMVQQMVQFKDHISQWEDDYEKKQQQHNLILDALKKENAMLSIQLQNQQMQSLKTSQHLQKSEQKDRDELNEYKHALSSLTEERDRLAFHVNELVVLSEENEIQVQKLRQRENEFINREHLQNQTIEDLGRQCEWLQNQLQVYQQQSLLNTSKHSHNNNNNEVNNEASTEKKKELQEWEQYRKQTEEESLKLFKEKTEFTQSKMLFEMEVDQFKKQKQQFLQQQSSFQEQQQTSQSQQSLEESQRRELERSNIQQSFSQILELQRQLNDRATQSEQIQAQIEEHQRMNKTQLREIDTLKYRIQILEREKEQLQVDKQGEMSAEQELLQKEETINQLKKDNLKMNKTLLQLKEELGKYQGQLQELNKAVQEKDKAYKEQKDQFEQLVKLYQVTEEKRKEIEKTNNEFQQQILATKSDFVIIMNTIFETNDKDLIDLVQSKLSFRERSALSKETL